MSKHNPIWTKYRLLAAVVAFFVSLSTANAGLFNPQTFTLPNGLQVVVLTNNRAPIVKQILLYKAGSIDEVRGKSGIAHFLEHLMFKGTKNVSGKDLDKMNEKAGADQNAQTGRDYTFYHQEIAKKDLEDVMRLEADRMQNLLIAEEAVESERPVIIEERRMRIDNEPKSILWEAMYAAFYRQHPYRLPIIGWENEMEKLSQADVRDFYDKWYAPNNAVLVLAGDITVEEAKTLATKYYGGIPRRELPPRNLPAEPDHREVNLQVEKKSDRVLEPVVYRLYPAPAQRDNVKASYALSVFEQIIGDGANGLLFDALVTNRQVASGVSVNYADDMARGPAVLLIGAQPAPGKSLAEVEQALFKEINSIIEKGVTHEQVVKAKNRLVADIDFLRDDSFGGAEIFAHALGTGYNIEDIEDIKERTLAVTPEDVNAVAKAVLQQKDYLTGRLLPQDRPETAKPEVEKAKKEKKSK